MKKAFIVILLFLSTLIAVSLFLFRKIIITRDTRKLSVSNSINIEFNPTDELNITYQEQQLSDVIFQLKAYKTTTSLRPIDHIRLLVTSQPLLVTGGYVLKAQDGTELTRRYLDSSNVELSVVRIYINKSVMESDPQLANKYLVWGLLDLLEANYPDSNQVSQNFVDTLAERYANTFQLSLK